MSIIGSAAVGLVLLLSPSVVVPQSTVPTKPCEPGHRQPSQSEDSSSLGAGASAKSETADLPQAPGGATTTQKPDEKSNSSDLKQSSRMFGIVPNFGAVSPNQQLPRLTTREKFVLARHDSMDYSSFVLVGILSANSLRANAYPELGSGAAGFGRYYWRAFTDQVSGTYFTEAIVPALTHEDPRYYTLGKGGFWRRTGYAISRVVITKTDSGGSSFNTSEILGNALEAGLSNAYYPPQERGAVKTTENWATQTVVTGAANVLKEFWPDIRRDVFRLK